MNKIKTFEDACKALNLNSTAVIPDFSAFPETHQKSMIAHSKLIIIAEALNEGWKPDWSDSDQYKYYPWFDMEESASGGFSSHVCAADWTSSIVGSRLSFKSRELAEYAGTQFLDLYKDYFVIE